MYSDETLRKLAVRYADHTRKASNASAKWSEQKEWLEGFIAANPSIYASDGSKRSKIKEDWEMEDQLGTWRWHRDEAIRIGDMIRTELALWQMLLGV